MDKPTLRVCINERFGLNSPSCGARGGKELLRLLREEAARRNLDIAIEPQICFGHCPQGPNVRLAPEGRFWHGVGAGDVAGIVDEVAGLGSGPGECSGS